MREWIREDFHGWGVTKAPDGYQIVPVEEMRGRVVMNYPTYRLWQQMPGYTRQLDRHVVLTDGTLAETLPGPAKEEPR